MADKTPAGAAADASAKDERDACVRYLRKKANELARQQKHVLGGGLRHQQLLGAISVLRRCASNLEAGAHMGAPELDE